MSVDIDIESIVTELEERIRDIRMFFEKLRKEIGLGDREMRLIESIYKRIQVEMKEIDDIIDFSYIWFEVYPKEKENEGLDMIMEVFEVGGEED